MMNQEEKASRLIDELFEELREKDLLIKKLKVERASLSVAFVGMTIGWALAYYGAHKGIKIAERSMERHQALYDRTMYLLDTLERKGINVDEYLDEFDLIALRSMMPSEGSNS